MVFTGQPSKGCHTCKTRKIKCDETRPLCQKCISTGRQCPGVPDDFEVIHRKGFKLPNSKTKYEGNLHRKASESKLEQSTTLRRIAPKSDPSENESDTTEDSAANALLDLMWSLETFPSDIAIAFYFHHYMPISATSLTEHYLSCVQPMFSRASNDSPLQYIISAVALAAFSNDQQERSLREKSLNTYGIALQKLRAVLMNPTDAKADEVLLAILLMVFFETLIPAKDAWGARRTHIKGALSLLRLRGLQQIKQPTALRLFRAVRSNMQVVCIHEARTMPALDETNRWYLEKVEQHYQPLQTGSKLCFQVAPLRARAQRVLADDLPYTTEEDVRALLKDALRLESNMEEWVRNLPSSFQASTVPCFFPQPSEHEVDTAEIWPGLVEISGEGVPNNTMSNSLLSRIYLQGIILACMHWLIDNGHGLEFGVRMQQCHYALQELVNTVCAAIPRCLGIDVAALSSTKAPAFSSASSSSSAASTTEPETNHTNRAAAQPTDPAPLAAYCVMYAACVAANVETVPEAQRRWLRGRLQAISQRYGFRIAYKWSTRCFRITTFQPRDVTPWTWELTPFDEHTCYSFGRA